MVSSARLIPRLVLAAIVAAAALWSGSLSAEPRGTTPGASPNVVVSSSGGVVRSRLVRRFDFEERKLGNYEDLPMNWHVIGRKAVTPNPAFSRVPLHVRLVGQPGYPTFCPVRFDASQRTSGEYSLMLRLSGGNVGTFIEAGLIPASPGADYRFTASVRTQGLKWSGARVIAYFIDNKGQRIDASVVASQPVRTGGTWQSVMIDLPGDYPDAAWIGMQVEVDQKTADERAALGKHEILYQDISGGAWFDDISVWQVPRVSLTTQSPVNILRAPEKPSIEVAVRDEATRAVAGEVRVFDSQGRIVAQSRQPVRYDKTPGLRWTPDLPGFGWYSVELTLFDMSRTGPAGEGDPASAVARTYGAFIWLGPHTVADKPALRRFGIDATGASAAELRLLPLVVKNVGVGGAVVSCWDRTTSRHTIEQRANLLDSVIDPMLAHGTEVSLCLSPLPDELLTLWSDVRPGTLSLLVSPDQPWQPYLTPMMLRLGQRVARWQMGSADDPLTQRQPELSAAATRVTSLFRERVPQPLLALPWGVDQARKPDPPSGCDLAMWVPRSVSPDLLPTYMTDWNDARSRITMHLDVPGPAELPTMERVKDFAVRMIDAWETQPGAVVLSRPWKLIGDHRPTFWPDPLAGVMSCMIDRLSGRSVVGRMKLAPGVKCLILDGPGGGMLAAWNESAKPERAVIDVYLGGNPAVIDVWGNRRAMELKEGRHRLRLTQTPQFVEGIDASLALFRASFHFQPSMLKSSQAPQSAEVLLSNPWPRTISGTLVLTEPRQWDIQPRRSLFNIAPGQSLRLPVQVVMPASALAGRKTVVARLELNATDSYVLELSDETEVGVPEVDFDAQPQVVRNRETGRDDVVIAVTVNSRSKEPLSLYVSAQLSTHPRQERLIPRLPPGESMVRLFRFEDAVAAAMKEDVRIGVRESSGPIVLNKLVSLGIDGK